MGSWKRMLVLALTTGALGVAVAAGPASAQRRPCMEDLKKFCPDAKPGTVEALKCLQAHQGELSDACKARIERGRARFQQGARTRDVCKSDIEKFCKDTPHGGGKVKLCLQEHQADLSPDCKAQLTAKLEKRKPTPGAPSKPD